MNLSLINKKIFVYKEERTNNIQKDKKKGIPTLYS